MKKTDNRFITDKIVNITLYVITFLIGFFLEELAMKLLYDSTINFTLFQRIFFGVLDIILVYLFLRTLDDKSYATKRPFVHGQSGVQGFFGITLLLEYWYQLFYYFTPGYRFKGIHFVAKTVTLAPRKGNTALRKMYKLSRFFPKSIWVSPKSIKGGYVLNAIGLSNPGLEYMLRKGYWQKRTEPFTLSLQLEEKEWDAIKVEIRKIATLLESYMPSNEHKYDIQLNESCPNTEKNIGMDEEAVNLIIKKVNCFKELLPGVDIRIKFNMLISVDALKAIQPHCNKFMISNTVPFGDTTLGISWEKYFPNGESPLPKRLGKDFAGGFSGKPLFTYLHYAMEKINKALPDLDVIAGGGIWDRENIRDLSEFKIVTGVAIGTVALLRPWRTQSLIRYGNKLFEEREENN